MFPDLKWLGKNQQKVYDISIIKITSDNAPEPVGSYPHARQVGNLLFLSGVGPRERGKKEIPGVNLDENGKIISYDIVVQCHSVFFQCKSHS